MTGNNYLLDTNIISALFKGEAVIANKIDEAANVCIPVITIGEIYFGAELSNNSFEYIRDIEKLKTSYPVCIIDNDACRHYAFIKARLGKKGKPIPENDIWIAAIALQNNLIVATRDNHFFEIDGLSVEVW